MSNNLCTAFWANLILAAINRSAGDFGFALFNIICAVFCLAPTLFDFYAFVKARRGGARD